MKAIKIFASIAIIAIALSSCNSNGQDKKSAVKTIREQLADRLSASGSLDNDSPYARLKRKAQSNQRVSVYELEQASIDSVCYLLGVNSGMLITQNDLFDEVSEINLSRVHKGIADAMTSGQPKNPYEVDSVWATGFEVSPYDMNKVVTSYISARSESQESTKETVDSVTYLIGVNAGIMFTGNDFFDEISEINVDEFNAGLTDAVKAGLPSDPYAEDPTWMKKFKYSPYEMNRMLTDYLAARSAYKAELNKLIGEFFLEDNAKKQGVQTTESGLQYVLHVEGEGDKVQPDDKVVVNYIGTLIDGTEFDANDGMTFQANHVIPGWTEGLGLMGKGGRATLFIPAELAYGERAPRGSVIAPNSTLIFEVEIVDIIRLETESSEE